MIDFNNSSTWGTPELHKAPAGFDAKGFQKKLDAIYPPKVEGRPEVRLVWAPSIKDCYTRRYSAWSNISNLGTESELRAKYKFAELKIDKDLYLDVPPPRWIIEERNDLGQVYASWEAGRWAKDGREMFPPLPPEGYYSELFKIVHHDGVCCKNTPKHIICWGQYRTPNDKDLKVIKKAKFLRDHDTEIALDKPLSAEVLASAARVTNNQIALKQEKADAKMKEFVDENVLELIAMFTGQPLSDRTKKFSLPTISHKENGIIVPAT